MHLDTWWLCGQIQPCWPVLILREGVRDIIVVRNCCPLMSLPIRYLPMASYSRLSIISFTLQILRHVPHWCDPSRPSCDHHRLYLIPITPSVWYHIGDLPYDLRTTSLHFPFLVSSLLPNAFFRGLTNHRSSHHAIGTLPYVLPHTDLVLILLIICI